MYGFFSLAKTAVSCLSLLNDAGEWVVERRRARPRKMSPEERQAREEAQPLESDIALTPEEQGSLCPGCRQTLGKGARRAREMKEDGVVPSCECCGRVKRRRKGR